MPISPPIKPPPATRPTPVHRAPPTPSSPDAFGRRHRTSEQTQTGPKHEGGAGNPLADDSDRKLAETEQTKELEARSVQLLKDSEERKRKGLPPIETEEEKAAREALEAEAAAEAESETQGRSRRGRHS